MATLNEVTTDKGTVNVSYSHCGDTEVIEVNLEELKRKETVRVGYKCPDLITQAVCAIKGIENHKDKILCTVTQLFAITGADIICTQLDSIYNYLVMQHEAMKDMEKYTPDDFLGVMNYVYDSIEVAKKLLELYQSKGHINDNVRELEYAQEGVLI